MKKRVYSEDVQRLVNGLTTLGLPIAADSSAVFSYAIPCYVYRNPDGTIRWLWPADASQPDFLRFYHKGTWRAQLFFGLVRCLFILKRQRWVAQDRLTLYTTADGDQRIRQFGGERWALFTGTAGPNRKLVLWYKARFGDSYFLKIALTPSAGKAIRQEALALRRLQQMPFLQLESPRLIAYWPGVVIQEDMGDVIEKPTNCLTDFPAGALLELVSRNWRILPLHQTTFWQQSQRAIRSVRAANDTRIPIGLIDKLDSLMHRLDGGMLVPVAAAHGDFTPWNSRLRKGQVCVMDWELAQSALPGLYDLFHFQYQTGTLIGNRGFGTIRREIDNLLDRPEWRLFRESHRMDAELAEVAYLIYTISYYLSVYSRQPDWHQQVNWLLTTWNDALTYWLSRWTVLSDRQLVLTDVAFWLHQKLYAAMKFLPDRLLDLPETSDIDLCLPRTTARSLTAWVQQHPLVSQVVVEQRSFMGQLFIRCRDNTCLPIDMIWSFKRKYLEFMAADAVWQQANLGPHGLKVPRRDADQSYIRLFYGLNKAAVPERYQALFNLSDAPQSSEELLDQIRQLPHNQGLRGVRNRLLYGWDTLRSLSFRRGMVVTFSGVDGAGKSTVIEQVKHQIEKQLRRRVVVLRHRPSVLPMLSAWKYGRQGAEQRAVETLPRQGTNQSLLSSLMRFAYYFADYLIGQFYIQVKYVWRGYVVLYDRYYFDFINDSRRSNLQLPHGLANRLYGLLVKPRLNVFLYAPPEEILLRKQELDRPTIVDLTRQYRHLFDRLQKKYPRSEYISVLNLHLPQTLTHIFDRIRVYHETMA